MSKKDKKQGITVTVNLPDDMTEVQNILLDAMVEYAYSILSETEIDALIEHADELIAMKKDKEQMLLKVDK